MSAADCTDTNASFGTNAAATLAPQWDQQPLPTVSQWRLDLRNSELEMMGVPAHDDDFREQCLDQSVSWDSATKELLPGNLTNKKLGRTAEWHVVTHFDEPKFLQGLLARQQQESADVHAVAAA